MTPGVRSHPAPPAVVYVTILAMAAAFGVTAGHDATAQWRAAGGSPALAGVLAIVWLAQVVGAFYLLGFLFKSIHYGAVAPLRPAPPPDPGAPAMPPVAVLYLTAGDFDAEAVDSLLRLRGPGPRRFILHDDGADPAARERMRRFLEEHECAAHWTIEVLHRPERKGGKAGAVNWVLERLDPEVCLLLLCDSDSIALEPDALEAAAAEFADPDVAVVQFRNAGVESADDTPLMRTLVRSIDVYDAFATPQAAWGYLPFFGHNALLRVADLYRLGGLTPGFFSDDLDYSVRLTLAGRRIVYRRDIAFAERLPADWQGFRKRARKWAFGCMQVVRARLGAVCTTRGVPFAHRVGLIEFMGFYPAQALLITGLLAAHLVLPFMTPAREPSVAFMVGGTVVALAVLAPTLAWAARAGRLAQWPVLAWSCVLVYGGSVLPTVRGVLDGLSRRERPWVPTNLAQNRPRVPGAAWAEAALGAALIQVPLALGHPAAYFPAAYLFVAVFLFSPLTFAAYRDGGGDAPDPAPAPRSAGAAAALLLAALLGGAGWPVPAAAQAADVAVRGEQLLVDGRPYEVRGIHYGPWPPGQGPGGDHPFPESGFVNRDLDGIAATGANTILVHEPPGRVVDAALERGLRTIVAFHIPWSDTSAAAFDAAATRIVEGVGRLKPHEGIIAWILGNEVPLWVVDLLGAPVVEARLRDLAERVRAVDASRPLGHAGWPPTRHLDLTFMDIACFNLYPAWPYEVSVRGFGPFLREVLTPLAAGRPLLVTEFGINSLEASPERQSEVLVSCWREIEASRAIGGVVFEWADEWWKNFDNPIPGKGYWERTYDPTDAERHDEDPEEHYGLVRADRTPKPALAALRAEWTDPGAALDLRPWAAVAALAVITVLVLRLGVRRRRSVQRAAGRGARNARQTTALLWWAAAGLACAHGTATAGTWSQADTSLGLAGNDQFGHALAGLGDIDGDGRGEIAIAARFALVGQDSAAGVVYVMRRGLPAGLHVARLEGASPDEHFGEAVAGAADVDDDGMPDMAVGAPLRDSGRGAVEVFRGGAAGPQFWFAVEGEAADDWFGNSVALGDLDGDGHAELIVGAPYNDRAGSAAGAVFVYRGGPSPPASPWLVFTGEQTNHQFGWSVSAVGDMNGDGYGDLVVGARLFGTALAPASGKAYLFHGGPAMDAVADGAWVGAARDDWFANSVAGPGDVDGGGRPDVLIGAPYSDRAYLNGGAAYLFRGEDAPGSAPLVVYDGESFNAQFGWSVGAAGSANGDAWQDVVVGARLQSTPSGFASGRVYLFAGAPAPSAVAVATADGANSDDWFGHAVAGADGYFTGGWSALAGGAPLADPAGSASGMAIVLGLGPVVAVPPAVADAGRLRAMPNPSYGAVRFVLGGTTAADARVEIVDVAGRVVRRLRASDASADWDGRDAAGRAVPPGVYLARASGAAPGGTGLIRLVVLK